MCCNRKTWCLSFKQLQQFKLALIDGWLQEEGCMERWCMFFLCCKYQRPPSHCSQAQGAPGCVGRVCISLLPSYVFSKVKLHHQDCSSHSPSSMIPSTGCWVGEGPWGCPGTLPIPCPGPSPAPIPLQTWGIPPPVSCLGCILPNALLYTHVLLRIGSIKTSEH